MNITTTEICIIVAFLSYFGTSIIINKMSWTKRMKAAMWFSRRKFNVIKVDHLEKRGQYLAKEIMGYLLKAFDDSKKEIMEGYLEQGVVRIHAIIPVDSRDFCLGLAEVLRLTEFNFKQIYGYRKNGNDTFTESTITAALQSISGSYVEFTFFEDMTDIVKNMSVIQKVKMADMLRPYNHTYLHLDVLIAMPETNPHYAKYFLGNKDEQPKT